MSRLKLAMSSQAEQRLRVKIAEQVGRKARKIVEGLHERILDHTPFNTGRTLGSWFGSADRPVYHDIGENNIRFHYSDSNPHTNHLPVGEEGALRDSFKYRSLRTTQSIKFEQSPYRKFFIANGAQLDSGAGLTEETGGSFKDLTSDLPQGVGSRALMIEYGVIAKYDLYASGSGHKVFSFEPRGTLGVQMSVLSILRDYRRL